MIENPLISVVILNHNQTKVTCEFLESTRQLNYPNYEILVIDNASKINPTEEIEQGNYPNVRLILNKENLGFTGGNNQGIILSKGEYVFIVNNDTEVTPSLLHELIKPFREDEKIAVVCPKIRYFEKPNVIQYAGYHPMNPYTGRAFSVGGYENDEGQYDKPSYTNFAHGAAMLVKKSILKEVGLFPDYFFIYYEEMDLSSRVLEAGYKIFYQATGLIFHKESMTMGKESPLKAYYHTRNRIAYMRRNTNTFQLFVFILFLLFFIFPKAIFKYIIKGQVKHLRSFIKGLTWHLATTQKEVNVQTILQ